MIYAVIGTKLFSDRKPEYFADFATSLFTMFQVLAGDSWSSAITRSFFKVSPRIRPSVLPLPPLHALLLSHLLPAPLPPESLSFLALPPTSSLGSLMEVGEVKRLREGEGGGWR